MVQRKRDNRASTRDNNKALQNLFEKLNHQFFYGRLPRYTVRLIRNFPPKGTCRSDRNEIHLRQGMTKTILRQTLLHEMCHIGEPYHGCRFLAKLRRLAQAGEKWAEKEEEVYRSSPSWSDRMSSLRDSLDELAWLSPRPKFVEVVKQMAAYLGLYPAELKKKVPWLRNAWRKACEEDDFEKDLGDKFDKASLEQKS